MKMKKIVFLYALVISFSIVLSENLDQNNDKTLDGRQPIVKDNVMVGNTVVDTKPSNSSDNTGPISSDSTTTTKSPATLTASTSKPPKPITTTPATTTTKVPETTTTTTTGPPDTTTSTASPDTTTSTTVAPKPVPPYPKPSIGFWNSSCIMIQMAGQLNITYETKDSKNVTVLYNIPKDAKLHDSDCSNNNTQSMEINWGPANELNSLGLIFLKNGTNFYLYSMLFEIQAIGDVFPNAKENQTIHLVHSGITFKTPAKMSYHCTRLQSLNLTKSNNDTTHVGTFNIADMQIEAFRTEGHTKFSAAKDCDASDTPDIVPIAVGIALIVLILVVLLSYLVARRRSTARGYMSF